MLQSGFDKLEIRPFGSPSLFFILRDAMDSFKNRLITTLSVFPHLPDQF